MPQLDNRWLKDIDPVDKGNFEQALRTSTLVLGRLRAILESEYEKIERSEELESKFDNPNWPHLMAFKMGERARLRNTLALLNFLKE